MAQFAASLLQQMLQQLRQPEECWVQQSRSKNGRPAERAIYRRGG
jgi:hypothetical protein